MESIRIQCTSCGKTLRAAASKRGKTASCPQCGESILIAPTATTGTPAKNKAATIDPPEQTDDFLAGLAAAVEEERAAPAASPRESKRKRQRRKVEAKRHDETIEVHVRSFDSHSTFQPAAGALVWRAIGTAIGIFLIGVVLCLIPGIRHLGLLAVIASFCIVLHAVWRSGQILFGSIPSRDPVKTIRLFVQSVAGYPSNDEIALACLTPATVAEIGSAERLRREMERRAKNFIYVNATPEVELLDVTHARSDVAEVHFVWKSENGSCDRRLRWLLVQHNGRWYLTNPVLKQDSEKSAPVLLSGKSEQTGRKRRSQSKAKHNEHAPGQDSEISEQRTQNRVKKVAIGVGAVVVGASLLGGMVYLFSQSLKDPPHKYTLEEISGKWASSDEHAAKARLQIKTDGTCEVAMTTVSGSANSGSVRISEKIVFFEGRVTKPAEDQTPKPDADFLLVGENGEAQYFLDVEEPDVIRLKDAGSETSELSALRKIGSDVLRRSTPPTDDEQPDQTDGPAADLLANRGTRIHEDLLSYFPDGLNAYSLIRLDAIRTARIRTRSNASTQYNSTLGDLVDENVRHVAFLEDCLAEDSYERVPVSDVAEFAVGTFHGSNIVVIRLSHRQSRNRILAMTNASSGRDYRTGDHVNTERQHADQPYNVVRNSSGNAVLVVDDFTFVVAPESAIKSFIDSTKDTLATRNGAVVRLVEKSDVNALMIDINTSPEDSLNNIKPATSSPDGTRMWTNEDFRVVRAALFEVQGASIQYFLNRQPSLVIDLPGSDIPGTDEINLFRDELWEVLGTPDGFTAYSNRLREHGARPRLSWAQWNLLAMVLRGNAGRTAARMTQELHGTTRVARHHDWFHAPYWPYGDALDGHAPPIASAETKKTETSETRQTQESTRRRDPFEIVDDILDEPWARRLPYIGLLYASSLIDNDETVAKHGFWLKSLNRPSLIRSPLLIFPLAAAEEDLVAAPHEKILMATGHLQSAYGEITQLGQLNELTGGTSGYLVSRVNEFRLGFNERAVVSDTHVRTRDFEGLKTYQNLLDENEKTLPERQNDNRAGGLGMTGNFFGDDGYPKGTSDSMQAPYLVTSQIEPAAWTEVGRTEGFDLILVLVRASRRNALTVNVSAYDTLTQAELDNVRVTRTKSQATATRTMQRLDDALKEHLSQAEPKEISEDSIAECLKQLPDKSAPPLALLRAVWSVRYMVAQSLLTSDQARTALEEFIEDEAVITGFLSDQKDERRRALQTALSR